MLLRTAYMTKTNTLNVFLSKKNYNADFVRRNIYRPTEADATNQNSTPVTTVTIPYIKGLFRDHLTDLTALQHPCSRQTYNYVTALTD